MQQPEEKSGKVLALVSWIGFFVANGLAALIIRIVEADGNKFARWHAAEALNFQITTLVIWLPTFVPLWISLFFTTPAGGTNAPPWPFFAVFAIGGVLAVGSVVVVVIGCVKASNGEWWKCPVAIPFLRLHRRERRAQLLGSGRQTSPAG